VGQGGPGSAILCGYSFGGSEYLTEPTALRVLFEINGFHNFSLSLHFQAIHGDEYKIYFASFQHVTLL